MLGCEQAACGHFEERTCIGEVPRKVDQGIKQYVISLKVEMHKAHAKLLDLLRERASRTTTVTMSTKG